MLIGVAAAAIVGVIGVAAAAASAAAVFVGDVKSSGGAMQLYLLEGYGCVSMC